TGGVAAIDFTRPQSHCERHDIHREEDGKAEAGEKKMIGTFAAGALNLGGESAAVAAIGRLLLAPLQPIRCRQAAKIATALVVKHVPTPLRRRFEFGRNNRKLIREDVPNCQNPKAQPERMNKPRHAMSYIGMKLILLLGGRIVRFVHEWAPA